MQEEMHRCAREGTPRPESSAVRAHAPNAFWAFADSWKSIFHSGVVRPLDQGALPRLHLPHREVRVLRQPALGARRQRPASRSSSTTSCSTSRSSDKYDERQKAALAYAEAIAWGMRPTTSCWDRLHAHFSEPELVELGCSIALTFGQQSWIRLLGIDHHEYMAGTAASMAPGFRDRRGARRDQGRAGLLGQALRVGARRAGAPRS